MNLFFIIKLYNIFVFSKMYGIFLKCLVNVDNI